MRSVGYSFVVFAALWAVSPNAATAVAPEGACVAGPESLCLLNQIAVEVEWQDAAMNNGMGQVLPLVTLDYGFFSYDAARYLELQVQVVDACGFNDRYWVLMAGLSDYAQNVTITDTSTGNMVTYNNPQGAYSLSLLDTDALPCAPAADGAMPEDRGMPAATTLVGSSSAVLSLGGGRYEARVDWEDFGGNTGAGTAIPVTADSGAFGLIGPTTPDLAIKVFDGSAINGSTWVVFGGPTNLKFDLQVTDVCTGQVRTYSNPLGVQATTQADTAAFVASPSCLLLIDGFESGSTSAWTSAVP